MKEIGYYTIRKTSLLRTGEKSTKINEANSDNAMAVAKNIMKIRSGRQESSSSILIKRNSSGLF